MNMKNPGKVFSKIYDQYINKIYRFIFLKVNSQEVAEDLTSETFLRGWQAFKKSQNPMTPEGEPPRRRTSSLRGRSAPYGAGNDQKIENIQAFLYQIARNLVIDHYREKGKARFVSAESAQINDPRINLEEKAIALSDFDNIRKALASLKEGYQTVIIWHYLDDLSISEIAKITEKSEGTTRVMLHRALKALKNELKLV